MNRTGDRLSLMDHVSVREMLKTGALEQPGYGKYSLPTKTNQELSGCVGEPIRKSKRLGQKGLLQNGCGMLWTGWNTSSRVGG